MAHSSTFDGVAVYALDGRALQALRVCRKRWRCVRCRADIACERGVWEGQMIRIRIEGKCIRQSTTEGRESVHLFLNRKHLLAAAGALCLCHRRLKEVEEMEVVLRRQRIQKLFYETC